MTNETLRNVKDMEKAGPYANYNILERYIGQGDVNAWDINGLQSRYSKSKMVTWIFLNLKKGITLKKTFGTREIQQTFKPTMEDIERILNNEDHATYDLLFPTSESKK